ncbi:hypothetical protein ACHQM5_019985 [Ranunculus cassubicifolius]
MVRHCFDSLCPVSVYSQMQSSPIKEPYVIDIFSIRCPQFLLTSRCSLPHVKELYVMGSACAGRDMFGSVSQVSIDYDFCI